MELLSPDILLVARGSFVQRHVYSVSSTHKPKVTPLLHPTKCNREAASGWPSISARPLKNLCGI